MTKWPKAELTPAEWTDLLGRAAMVGYALSRTGPSKRGRYVYSATYIGVCREIGDAHLIRTLVGIVAGATE